MDRTNESMAMTPTTVNEQALSPEWRGRVGMIGLICAETSLFLVFVVAYLFYIGKSINGPYPKDVLELPIFNTVCLLSSSISVGLAVRALRRGRVGVWGVWVVVPRGLGGGCLAG